MPVFGGMIGCNVAFGRKSPQEQKFFGSFFQKRTACFSCPPKTAISPP
jgi:hypothetical protein